MCALSSLVAPLKTVTYTNTEINTGDETNEVYQDQKTGEVFTPSDRGYRGYRRRAISFGGLFLRLPPRVP